MPKTTHFTLLSRGRPCVLEKPPVRIHLSALKVLVKEEIL